MKILSKIKMLPINELLRNNNIRLPSLFKETNPGDDNNSLENDDWLGDR